MNDPKVKIIKEKNDKTNVLRLSMGGTPELGYYFIYRGNINDIITMIRTALAAILKKYKDNLKKN